MLLATNVFFLPFLSHNSRKQSSEQSNGQVITMVSRTGGSSRKIASFSVAKNGIIQQNWMRFFQYHVISLVLKPNRFVGQVPLHCCKKSRMKDLHDLMKYMLISCDSSNQFIVISTDLLPI